MALQPVSQKKSRFVQLAASGLLVIQATIVTTTISAFVSTNSGRMSASAQETQPSVPMPGTANTSASDLSPTPIVANCSAVKTVLIRLSHCPPENGGTPPGRLDPGVLIFAGREINNGVRLEIQSREHDSIEMRIVFPLP